MTLTMDELLHERVKQLQEIKDRLDRLPIAGLGLDKELASLRWDLIDMIRRAQDEYDAF